MNIITAVEMNIYIYITTVEMNIDYITAVEMNIITAVEMKQNMMRVVVVEILRRLFIVPS